MRRRIRYRGHWGLVALCLGVAFCPLDVRTRARGALLDAHAFLLTALNGGAPAAEGDARSSQVALLEAELTRLRRALHQAGAANQVLKLNPKARLIPAEVLPLAGEADLVHRVSLARGERDGVRRGLPVLADGVLVGRVASVTAATCEVRLVTDPKFKIRATIPQGDREVEGMLTGNGTLSLTFEPALLDESAPAPVLRPGDSVFCSRASVLCGLPALLGRIESTGREPGARLAAGRVSPARDLFTIRQAVIVLPEKEPAS